MAGRRQPATRADRPAESSAPKGAAPVNDAVPEPASESTPPAAVDSWSALVSQAGLRGAVRNLADHCELSSNDGNRFELVLARDKANFNTDQLRGRLEQALGEHLGGRVSIRIVVGDPPRATPAEVRRANEDERMRRTREAIEQDPNIQAVQAAFDAVLEPDSIQPVEPKGQ